MGKTTKTEDVTAGQNLAGTANERDINSNYSTSFYDFLSGGAYSRQQGAEAQAQLDALKASYGNFINNKPQPIYDANGNLVNANEISDYDTKMKAYNEGINELGGRVNEMANLGKTSQSLIGGIGDFTANQTNQALSGWNAARQQQAGMDSETQRRQIEQRLSGSGILGSESGAAKMAIARAIADPYARANTDMQQAYAQMYQQNYGGLMGNLANMSQQAIVAPQYVTSDTGWGKILNMGTAFAGAKL